MFVSELLLMHLELRKEDLFALLLHCWQLHRPMEVAIVEVAEKVCPKLHEFMYQHECRLLCNVRPMNQFIRSRKQDDFDGASNIILPCPGS
jgi:hypothetical protein